MSYLGTKPANSPLTSELIPDGIISTSDLQNNSVTEAKLQSGLYTAKAWVNFNGTGTVAIRASGNVSSITDNNTGDYTINFTTAFADTNYNAVFGIGSQIATQGRLIMEQHDNVLRSTTQLRIYSLNTGTVLADSNVVSVSIFR